MTNGELYEAIKELKEVQTSLMNEILEIKEMLLKKKVKKQEGKKTLLSKISIEESKEFEDMNERAAVWFYKTLEPYHNNKQKFKNAKFEDWTEHFKLMTGTHKRNISQFVSLVKWMIARGDTGYMQSISFFTKDGGKNYDTFLGIMEAEMKKSKKPENVTFTPKSRK